MNIRRYLRLPAIADEHEAQRARMTTFIIWSVLLVTNIQFPVFFFLLPQNWLRWAAAIITLDLTMPALLLLNNRGRTQRAGILLLVEFWLFGLVMASTAGGVRAPVLLLYLVCGLIAGLLFGTRGTIIAASVFCLTGLGFVLVEWAGFLPANQVAHTPLSFWVSLSITLEFITIFQLMAVLWIRHALAREKAAQAALRRSHCELEMRVEERTSELRQANVELQGLNQELEAFTYSVSHDLRRPLRAVTGFSELLMEDHAKELSPEAKNLTTLIKDSAAQMNLLIDALLNLSRIDRQSMMSRPVNLAELARNVLKELLAELPERKVETRVADLPECMGDPVLLRQVLVNLLSNAIKFTRNRPDAMIEVGCRTEEGETMYFVRDDGVGFEMQNATKLFGVFQRLHSAKEFPGTGVGLSIVRRIIHRHGGKIWAEAAVGKGATFYFTLSGVPAISTPSPDSPRV